MPDLIQQANDLKNAPDAWLVQQAQRPTSPTPPYLVLAELHRRQLLRAGGGPGQKPPQSSVMQDTLRSTLDQLMGKPAPGPPPPAGMTPPAQKPPSGAMGTPMPGAAPPQNTPLPPKPMAEGGGVGSDDWSPDDIDNELSAAEQRYQLPQGLMHAVANTESGLNPRTRPSKKGAIGIMQLMPGTAKDLGVDPYDTQQNIDGGGRYLRQQLDRFGGDVPKALAAYNAGPRAVQRFGGIPPYPETENYVKRNQRMLSRGMAQTLFPSPAPTAPDGPVPSGAVAAAAGPPSPELAGLLGSAGPSGPAAAPGAPIAPGQPPVTEDPTIEPYRLTLEQAKKTRDTLRDSFKGHAPEEAYPIVNKNRADIEAILGPRPDFTRLQEAVTNLQSQAQQELHPTIWQTLQQLGAGILAAPPGYSFSHDFGAGMSSMLAHQEKQRQQARQNYIQALKAGVDLQSKMDTYDEKVATLKMNQVRALQGSWTEDQKEHARQMAEAQNDVDRAQLNWDKAKATSPDAKRTARQMEIDNLHIFTGRQPGVYDDRESGYIEYGDSKAPRPISLTKLNLAAAKAGVDISKGVSSLTPEQATKVQDEVDKMGQIILSDDEVKEYAKQFRTTFKLPPLGQGASGRLARQAILREAADQAHAENLSIPLTVGASDATRKALTNRTDQLSNITAFENTALANLDQMLKAAKPIVDSGSRWLNTPLRAIDMNLLSSGELAAYNAARQVLLTEFAKVNESPGLGGALSVTARDEVGRLLPENATMKDIYRVTDILKKDAENRRRELTAEVDYLQKQLGTPGGSIVGSQTAPTPPEPNKPSVQLPAGNGQVADDNVMKTFYDAASGDPTKMKQLLQQHQWTLPGQQQQQAPAPPPTPAGPTPLKQQPMDQNMFNVFFKAANGDRTRLAALLQGNGRQPDQQTFDTFFEAAGRDINRTRQLLERYGWAAQAPQPTKPPAVSGPVNLGSTRDWSVR